MEHHWANSHKKTGNLRILLYSLVISSQAVPDIKNKQETFFSSVLDSNRAAAFDLWPLIYWANGVTSPCDVVD